MSAKRESVLAMRSPECSSPPSQLDLVPVSSADFSRDSRSPPIPLPASAWAPVHHRTEARAAASGGWDPVVPATAEGSTGCVPQQNIPSVCCEAASSEKRYATAVNNDHSRNCGYTYRGRWEWSAGPLRTIRSDGNRIHCNDGFAASDDDHSRGRCLSQTAGSADFGVDVFVPDSVRNCILRPDLRHSKKTSQRFEVGAARLVHRFGDLVSPAQQVAASADARVDTPRRSCRRPSTPASGCADGRWAEQTEKRLREPERHAGSAAPTREVERLSRTVRSTSAAVAS